MATPEVTTEAEALNRRGIERLAGGDAAGALEDFASAVALAPDFAEAWNNRGVLRQAVGLVAESVADFDQALAARPYYAEARMNRARSRQALGDQGGARADLDGALAGASGRLAAAVLHNRGSLRQAAGDLDGALADYDAALAADPSHLSTYLHRGTARKLLGDLPGALADFDRALELAGPEGRAAAAAYHGRGGVRALQNDFAGAVADYDRALALEPGWACYHLSRGNARYHQRDGRGVVDYRVAFRVDPAGTAREAVRLVAADVRRGAEGLLDNCARHLRLNPRDLLALARRAVALELLGRPAEAAADLARCREWDADAANYLALALGLARQCREGPPRAAPAPEPAAVADALFALWADPVPPA